jgi:hypothetical protein
MISNTYLYNIEHCAPFQRTWNLSASCIKFPVHNGDAETRGPSEEDPAFNVKAFLSSADGGEDHGQLWKKCEGLLPRGSGGFRLLHAGGNSLLNVVLHDNPHIRGQEDYCGKHTDPKILRKSIEGSVKTGRSALKAFSAFSAPEAVRYHARTDSFLFP